MKLRDDSRAEVEEVLADAAALGDAMFANEMDEARFLVHRIAAKGTHSAVAEVSATAHRLAVALGPVGTDPGMGFGPELIALARALRRIGGVPLDQSGQRQPFKRKA